MFAFPKLRVQDVGLLRRARLAARRSRTPHSFLILRELASRSFPGEFSFEWYYGTSSALVPGGYDLVCLSAYTENVAQAYEIGDACRRDGVPSVIGGPHVSNCPEEALGHCDTVVIGEAEEIWPEILADFRAGKLRRSYRQGRPTDLARLPVLTYPRVQASDLRENMQTSRGCARDCAFCSADSVSRALRFVPVEHISASVRSLPPQLRSITFCDNDIFASADRFCSLFSELVRERVRWSACSCVDIAFDEKALGLARDSGCRALAIGFESLRGPDPRMAGKMLSRADYAEAIRRIHAKGIAVRGFFIIGFEDDTPVDLTDMQDFCNSTMIEEPCVTVLTPFPGSRVRERLIAKGVALSDQWGNYDTASFVFSHENFAGIDMRRRLAEMDRQFRSLSENLRMLASRPGCGLGQAARFISRRTSL